MLPRTRRGEIQRRWLQSTYFFYYVRRVAYQQWAEWAYLQWAEWADLQWADLAYLQWAEWANLQ